MNNSTHSFEEWYQQLCKELVTLGHSMKPDKDTAREDYDAGTPPKDSAQEFADEWA